MRIIQIIDSLEAGGAERMAVNYANALAERIDFSGLVVTRKQGDLRNQLEDNVSFLFLGKKSSLDINAVFKLRKFVLQNRVEVVHAHSTSIFFAILLKIISPRIRIIWHDHYGDSEFLQKRPHWGLKIASLFLKGIIAVNQNLKVWSQKQLHFENVIYLPNFPSKENEVEENTSLKGMVGKRILSLANLRLQKNHFLLLEVAKMLQVSHPDWTFHLVGKDFGDAYSFQIKNLILELNLQNTVFVYGSKKDVANIMKQATLAILTSQSEGLPVALLEYGWHSKPVVVTRVGEITLLVQEGVNGFIVDSNKPDLFYKAVIQLIEREELRAFYGEALYKTVKEYYSEEAVLNNYLNWLK
ncbi:MAG: glycosyltransferase [Flavobacterium sp.]|uniref:glycosyltransferase n=1 Tax=Flavobacterium sp. TaxID=239 RepID=UPI002608AD7E|nr:glycosyltransferase [Flavobacterium sp.]MDD5151442.1 glycosyltransferase [Flavobacterium sp.]